MRWLGPRCVLLRSRALAMLIPFATRCEDLLPPRDVACRCGRFDDDELPSPDRCVPAVLLDDDVPHRGRIRGARARFDEQFERSDFAAGQGEAGQRELPSCLSSERWLTLCDQDIPSEYIKKVQSAFLDALYAFLDGLVHVAFSDPDAIFSSPPSTREVADALGGDGRPKEVDVRNVVSPSRSERCDPQLMQTHSLGHPHPPHRLEPRLPPNDVDPAHGQSVPSGVQGRHGFRSPDAHGSHRPARQDPL